MQNADRFNSLFLSQIGFLEEVPYVQGLTALQKGLLIKSTSSYVLLPHRLIVPPTNNLFS